jgi:23S rRNA pseudouridine1911/1915/1917 synthase
VTGTLVNALLGHCKNLSGIGGVLRPGIVHRLDRETSGLMVVAKSDKAHQGLSDQFKKRTIEKLYLAVVHGHVEHVEGRIEAPIGRDPKMHDRRRVDPQRGKPATSEYRVLSEHGKLSLVQVKLLTGRTHQIRLHLAYLKHPIVGDMLYGRRDDARVFRGVALHSHKLAFIHPKTGQRLSFESPLPADIRTLLESQPGDKRPR